MSTRLKTVVAQSRDVGQDICEFLKEYGYEISAVTPSGQEAVDIICEQKPDVVISDVYLQDIDTCGMLELLKERGYGKNTVFVVASEVGSGSVIEELLCRGVDMFTLIPFNKKYADGKIRELVCRAREGKKPKGGIIDAHDEFEILGYVAKLMHEVGVPASIRGYDYIRESILMALSDRSILKSITKELYPSIARSNSTTASRVERAIRHAVEVAWQRGDVDILNGIFGYTVKSSKGKPTNGEFISMLTERVKLDLKIS